MKKSQREGYPIRLEASKEREEREFPSKRATVVFASLDRGSHDDFLYVPPNSNSNVLFPLNLYTFYSFANDGGATAQQI